jgi:hypothetical protein
MSRIAGSVWIVGRARMNVRRIALAASAAALVMLGGPAAAQYGPECAVLSTSNPPPGGDVDVSGGPGCFDGSTVGDPKFIEGFFIQSEVRIFRVQTNADGSYSTLAANPEIPRSARPGAAAIEVRGLRGGQLVTVSRSITVSGAAAADGARGVSLPATGGQIAMLAIWGLGLVAGGSILISATWRRFQQARVHTSDAQELRFIHPLETPPGEIDAYDLLRAALVRREKASLETAEPFWTEAYRLPDDEPVSTNGHSGTNGHSAVAVLEPPAAYSIWVDEPSAASEDPAPAPSPEPDPLDALRAELQAWSS